MKVLVTGATGFLGGTIVEEFLQNDFEVYATGRTAKTDLANYFPADLTDTESFSKLEKIGRVEAVIHSAGLAHQFKVTAAEKFRKTNIEGTRNAVNLAAKLEASKFILISSVLVYGTAKQTQKDKFQEDLQCQPDGFYAESKLEAEKVAAEICAENSIDLTILRPSVIIGENDKGNVARLIKLIDKRLFVWLGSGKNLKSLVYKTDVARACRHFVENSPKTKNNKTSIYNVTAAPVTMREIVSEIEKTLDRRVLPIHFPAKPLQKSLHLIGRASASEKLLKIAATFDKWLVDDVFSGEKIERETGFQIAVSADEAVRREALHYRKQK